MISKNEKIDRFILASIASVCSIVFINKPTSADEVYKSCAGVEVLTFWQIDSLSPSHTQHFDSIRPNIVVTKSTQSKSKKYKKKTTLVARGPEFTSADSFETRNSVLTCTDKGFDIVTKVTRSAAFKGSLRRNVP